MSGPERASELCSLCLKIAEMVRTLDTWTSSDFVELKVGCMRQRIMREILIGLNTVDEAKLSNTFLERASESIHRPREGQAPVQGNNERSVPQVTSQGTLITKVMRGPFMRTPTRTTNLILWRDNMEKEHRGTSGIVANNHEGFLKAFTCQQEKVGCQSRANENVRCT